MARHGVLWLAALAGPQPLCPESVARAHGDHRYAVQFHQYRFALDSGRALWSADCPHSKRFDTDITVCLAGWGDSVALLPIASNANDSDGVLAAAARKRKIPVVLRDADGSVAERYEALTTPHAFVIDRQGILRYRGAVDDVSFQQREPTRFYLKEAVETLLSDRLPEVTEVQPFGCTVARYQ